MFTLAEKAIIDRANDIIKSKSRDDAVAFTSPNIVSSFLITHLATYSRETFVVLFLDNQHRLIAAEDMFVGTINAASVYPREVVKRALELNAAAVIFSHNHPSGLPEPSRADRNITDKLVEACRLVDVRVLDHIVVGGADTVSFAERGWII